MTSPAGTTKYHYDTTTGRLDKITSPEGKEFTYSYDHGQLKEMQYPNGITAHYAFDDNGNLTDLHYLHSDGSTVQRFQYAYDKNDMRTSMTDLDGTHDYAYDAQYQITQATHPSVQNPLEQFSYDAVGNRLSDNVKSAYQYNELNQLTEDDSCTYAYDADGNMVSKVCKTTGDSTVYTYDIENRLIEVRKTGMIAKYTYDALGRRTKKNINGKIANYGYDRQDLILELNESDSITASFTYGPGIDNPLTMNRNNKSYYYVKDGLSSVTLLTDATSNTVHSYAYSTFGQIVSENGEPLANPFTYAGREFENEVGLFCLRARYYMPSIGRFINQDPIGFRGGDANFYRYVGNSPVTVYDPLGLSACKGLCWTDATINFGIGFIPGANAVKLIIEYTGYDVNLFQFLGGYENSPVDLDGLDAATGLSSLFDALAKGSYSEEERAKLVERIKRESFEEYSDKKQRRMMTNLGKLNLLRKIAAATGVVANLLNTIDYVRTLMECGEKCDKMECP
jgi:RHS repeat-associated protein